METQTKKCKKCLDDKDILEFYEHSKYKDRHDPMCKECRNKTSKEYAIANKEKLQEYRRKYTDKNKDKKRDYYQKNKQRILEQAKKYYQEKKMGNAQ